jgi:hypothetical protein
METKSKCPYCARLCKGCIHYLRKQSKQKVGKRDVNVIATYKCRSCGKEEVRTQMLRIKENDYPESFELQMRPFGVDYTLTAQLELLYKTCERVVFEPVLSHVCEVDTNVEYKFGVMELINVTQVDAGVIDMTGK